MRRLRFYPFLFALHPLVYVYCQIDEAFSVVTVVLVGLAVLALTELMIIVLRRYFDSDSSDISVSVFWIWLFSYSSFRVLVYGENVMLSEKFLIPIWIAIAAVSWWLILRKRKWSPNVNQFLNILGGMFLLIALWPHAKDPRKDFTPIQVVSLESASRGTAQPPDTLPNIYYILMDAYPAPSVLKRQTGIDDSGFTSFLREKRFLIADPSFSNYSYTLASLSSTLNMQYLPMASVQGINWQIDCNPKSLERSIRNNLVMRFLRSRGYKFVDLSIWDFGAENDYQYVHNYYVDRFVMELLHRTIISAPIIDNVIVGLEERLDDRLKLGALDSVSRLKGPLFIYMHLYSTHEPYVVDEQGKKFPLISRILQSRSDRASFEKQFRFVTYQAREAIEKILKGSSRPPIIIVQGDHGPPIAGDSKQLRMGMIEAFFLPGGRGIDLPPRISPVNNFRFILNNYFGAGLGLLENRHFTPTGMVFEDVSDSIMYHR